jgi:hypothetical protein
VGFVVDKVALEAVFSDYFGFPCQFSFHRMLHIHLPSGAIKIGQLVADTLSGLSLIPPLKKETCVASQEQFQAQLVFTRGELYSGNFGSSDQRQ